MVTRLRASLRTPLLQNASLLALARIVGTGLGFLFWVLAARLMPPEQVGIASGGVSAALLLAGLAQLGMGLSIIRHLAESNDAVELINLAILVLIGIGLLLAFGMLGGAFWFWPGLLPIVHQNGQIGVLFVLFVVAAAFILLSNSIFIALRRSIFSLAQQLVIVVASLSSLLLLGMGFHEGVAAFSAYTIGVVLGAACSAFLLLPRALPGYSVAPPRTIRGRLPFARYALSSYLIDQFQRLPDTLLVLVVIDRLGPAAGAYFFIAWRMGRAINAWPGSLADTLFAELAHDPAAADRHIRHAVRTGVALAAVLALAMFLIGPLLLGLYGEAYVQQAMPLFGLIAVAGIPSLLLAIAVNVLRARDRLREVFALASAGNIAGLVCAAWGADQFGLIGVGAGWLAAQCTTLIVAWVIGRMQRA